MKILHYNIHMWTDSDGAPNADRVEALIDDEQPDVVSLVEVDEPWGQPSTLAGIAERLGYSWAFVPAFEYRCQGGFGNAILSRHPLLSVQQWQLLSPRLYDGTEPSEPRALALCTVEIEGTRVLVGSTHLPRYDPTMRTEASERLLGLLDQLPTPWIVCGDFNQPPEAWLSSPWEITPAPSVATYPTKDPVEAIDYAIFRGVEAIAAARQSTASDHLPIVVTTSG